MKPGFQCICLTVEALEHSRYCTFLEWTYFSHYAGSEIPELTTGSGRATGGQLVHDAQCMNTHWATLCLPNSWNTYYHFLTGHEVSYSILVISSY